MAAKNYSNLQLYILFYHHKHGTDLFPVLRDPRTPLPQITNDLLEGFEVNNPSLEDGNGDEWAEWVGPWDLDKLGRLSGGVLDWTPE